MRRHLQLTPVPCARVACLPVVHAARLITRRRLSEHQVFLGKAVCTSLQVGAVVVGHDRNINYHKIQYATLCIRENRGCHFIATNLDAVTHLTDAQEWAGNGAMVGAIRGESCKVVHG